MQYKKSCGAVIIYQNPEDNTHEYLVIKHKYSRGGGYWDFPKWHVEHGEAEKETALREVYEETGLEIELIPGFRESIVYKPRQYIEKNVVYFFGISKSKDVRYIFDELEDHKWLPYRQAFDMLTFTSGREVIEKAKEFLENQI